MNKIFLLIIFLLFDSLLIAQSFPYAENSSNFDYRKPLIDDSFQKKIPSNAEINEEVIDLNEDTFVEETKLDRIILSTKTIDNSLGVGFSLAYLLPSDFGLRILYYLGKDLYLKNNDGGSDYTWNVDLFAYQFVYLERNTNILLGAGPLSGNGEIEKVDLVYSRTGHIVSFGYLYKYSSDHSFSILWNTLQIAPSESDFNIDDSYVDFDLLEIGYVFKF